MDCTNICVPVNVERGTGDGGENVSCQGEVDMEWFYVMLYILYVLHQRPSPIIELGLSTNPQDILNYGAIPLAEHTLSLSLSPPYNDAQSEWKQMVRVRIRFALSQFGHDFSRDFQTG